jgi:hypothetical protein
MSGRGDKNKSGTSGQGAGNRSGQGFSQTPDRQNRIMVNKQVASLQNRSLKQRMTRETEPQAMKKKKTNGCLLF